MADAAHDIVGKSLVFFDGYDGDRERLVVWTKDKNFA